MDSVATLRARLTKVLNRYPSPQGDPTEAVLSLAEHAVKDAVSAERKIHVAVEAQNQKNALFWYENAKAAERRAEEAKADLDDLRARMKALIKDYEDDARNEGYGGELWSTTASRISAVLERLRVHNVSHITNDGTTALCGVTLSKAPVPTTHCVWCPRCMELDV